jgi:excisionase family DNA binding protein
MSSDFISAIEAARCVGVTRRTIYYWLKAGRIPADSRGRILRDAFERSRAPHVLISRLRNTINQIPPHSLASILIETLSADYVLALSNVLNGSNNFPEKTGVELRTGNVSS